MRHLLLVCQIPTKKLFPYKFNSFEIILLHLYSLTQRKSRYMNYKEKYFFFASIIEMQPSSVGRKFISFNK